MRYLVSVCVLLLAASWASAQCSCGASCACSPGASCGCDVSYRWERYRDMDTTQAKLMRGCQQVGVWEYASGRYYAIITVGGVRRVADRATYPPIMPPADLGDVAMPGRVRYYYPPAGFGGPWRGEASPACRTGGG